VIVSVELSSVNTRNFNAVAPTTMSDPSFMRVGPAMVRPSSTVPSPDKELRHILQVRDTFYPFLKHAPVPVTDANHRAFGVAAIPVNILIDRHGIVSLYHPGRMADAVLEDLATKTRRIAKPRPRR
jgi:hypothetical protein